MVVVIISGFFAALSLLASVELAQNDRGRDMNWGTAIVDAKITVSENHSCYLPLGLLSRTSACLALVFDFWNLRRDISLTYFCASSLLFS